MFDSKYTSAHNYIFQEVNGKVNSLRAFYSNELKKFSDGKKTGAALDDTYELNGPISLKLKAHSQVWDNLWQLKVL